MESEVEYLSEWPPPSEIDTDTTGPLESISYTSGDSEIALPYCKRPKLELSNGASVYAKKHDEIGRESLRSKGTIIPSDQEQGEVLSSNQLQGLSSEEIHIAHSQHSVKADVLLARWWKSVGSKLDISADSAANSREENILSLVKSNTGPQSQLYHISRLQRVKTLLKCRIHYLNSLIPSVSVNATPGDISSLHISIATCHKRLSASCESECVNRHLTSALKHCKIAMEVDSGNREEGLWLSKLLERQREVEISKERATERLSEVMGAERGDVLKMPQPIQVERRHVDDLSAKEFFEQYASRHTPVVITGLVDHMTSTQPWTLDYIKKAIGHKCGPLKRMVCGSVSWARLEPAGECRVSTFIDSLEKTQDLSYLFDWSLPVNCPELVKELNIPKYFANDFLQRTPAGSLYQDSWPSLFIAPARISSELHVDAFGSNFWMALFQGQKRWLFFPPEDIPLLYPVFDHSTDATFSVDLAAPDLILNPLLSLTHPRECVLIAGEVLFVPAGSPHRVENLSMSLAISANFVDRSNFDHVLGELRVNAIQDERAADLLSLVEGENFDREMVDFDSEKYSSPCVPWQHFKLH